jgi:CHAD domain-containing protein
MTVSGHIELERKYDADADFAIPDLREVPGCARVGDPEAHTLHASYFDTDDLRLAVRGITLRRRHGGSDAGWHLKVPIAKNTKREIHAPLAAGRQTVPPELAALVAVHVRARALAPVAEVETRRTERALLAEDGQVLAELADDVVSARRLSPGGNEVGLLSWRELEVEAVTGSGELLERLGGHLLDSGAREAETASKLERTLKEDLARVERPVATDTAGDILVTYLGEQFEQWLAYDPLVRLSDHDDDSVHRMRVAVRRTRSLLRTHRRLLDRAGVAPLEAELKWLADALGEVRDLEVLSARFHQQLTELPGVHQSPAWLAGMAATERRTRDQLRETLLTSRYFDLLDAVDAFLAAPPMNARARRSARDETPKMVVKAWRKMVRHYAKAERLPAGDERDAALHRTRKATKRARYTAEAAVAALGSPAGKLAQRAEKLQGILGAHHDSVVAAQRLTDKAAEPGTPAADIFTLGRLTELQRWKGTRALQHLPDAAKKAGKPKQLRALGRQ